MLTDKITCVSRISSCDVELLNKHYLDKDKPVTIAIECHNGLPETYVYELEG